MQAAAAHALAGMAPWPTQANSQQLREKTSNGTYVVGLHVARRRRVHRVALAGGRTTHWDGGLLGTCGQHTEIEVESKNKIRKRTNTKKLRRRRRQAAALCRRRKQANCDLVGRARSRKEKTARVAGRARVNADGCERECECVSTTNN